MTGYSESRICLYCNNKFTIISHKFQIYCNTTCAHGGRRLKRKDSLSRLCKRCGSPKDKYAKICRKCRDIGEAERAGNMTVSEAIFKRGHQSAHVRTRAHAKAVMRNSQIKKLCVICGYDKYVEICHIKPISAFPDDALLSDVNSLSNIVYMCPNHHKEFDKGLMEIADKLKLQGCCLVQTEDSKSLR